MAVNFEIPTTEVKVGEGSFTVRGMNSEDIVFLSSVYLDDMKNVVAKYGEHGAIRKNRVADLVMEIAKAYPMMTVEIISRCAEATDSESVSKFRRLSFVKQIEALKAITLLTVEDGGIDIKKVMGFAVSLLEANGIQPGPLATSLQTIIETSAKT